MKKLFPGYYHPTGSELSEMWKAALFVLDANVLLNLYRYSPQTRDAVIGTFKSIADRVWLPNQAAAEYHRNRINVIAAQEDAYAKITQSITDAKKKLDSDLRQYTRHPYVNAGSMIERISALFKEIEMHLTELENNHPNLIENDDIKDALTELFNGKVGDPYPPARLQEIYKEGKDRYEQEIPPGYKDGDKKGSKPLGDLIFWFQVIDKAQKWKAPIILITDDRKEDWWLKHNGQTIGPRPELVSEIKIKASVEFYMYQADPFMEHANTYLAKPVKQEVIDEVRTVRNHDEAQLKLVNDAFREYIGAVSSLPNPIQGHSVLDPLSATSTMSEHLARTDEIEKLRAAVSRSFGDSADIGKFTSTMSEHLARTDEIEKLRAAVSRSFGDSPDIGKLTSIMSEHLARADEIEKLRAAVSRSFADSADIGRLTSTMSEHLARADEIEKLRAAVSRSFGDSPDIGKLEAAVSGIANNAKKTVGATLLNTNSSSESPVMHEIVTGDDIEDISENHESQSTNQVSKSQNKTSKKRTSKKKA